MKRSAPLAAVVGLTLALSVTGCTDPSVSATMKSIDSIGTVSIESKDAIDSANKQYDSLIKSLKKKEFIYCGDAGLGSASIRAFNDMGGRAFIVTQSIKKLNEEFQNVLLKDEGFKLLSNDKAITLNELKSFDKFKEENINLYEDKAYKSIIVDSNIDLGLLEEKKQKNGKTKLIKSKAALKQKIIITYSRKMAEYQKHIRNKQIERAKALIKKGVDDIRKGPNDISRFIMKEN